MNKSNSLNRKTVGLFDVQSFQMIVVHQRCNQTWATPAVIVNGRPCNTERVGRSSLNNPQQSVMISVIISLGVVQLRFVEWQERH